MVNFRIITWKSSIIGLAAAVDIGVWRGIVVHPSFHHWPLAIRQAILAHEEGHLLLGHLRQRWRWAFTGLWWRDPDSLAALLQEQEYEADAYCASRGLSGPLIALLLKSADRATKVRPSSQDRIARLRGYDEFCRCVPTWRPNSSD